MTKIDEKKKSCNHEKIDKILLFCVDNEMETQYTTAEIEKQNLLIRFTSFNHFKDGATIDYIYKFEPKETDIFVKLIAENKSEFLYKLQEMFNTATACQDIIQYADNHFIKYNFEEKNLVLRYNFGDIYEDIPRLYYKDGSLIIPTLYKHPKNGIVKIYLPSGYLYMEISYKNNLKDGMTKIYFENSKQVALKQNYTKDKLNGIARCYSMVGKLEKEEPFVNGVKQGWEKTYNYDESCFKEGYLEKKIMYAKNQKNGEAFKYYPNGQIKHLAHFENGKQDGYSISYKEKTGEIENKVLYRQGKLIDYCNNDGTTGVKNLDIKES